MSNHLNPSDVKAYTRRAFLQNSTLFASAALTVPAFLQSSAFALPRPMEGLSSIAGVDEDKILVVIQLSGGNDGLNTLVPFGQDGYQRVRPRIALSANEVLKLDRHGGLGLHGSMSGFKNLYDQGLCGIVQGVGQALLEHGVYDSDGQLLSGSFMDYTMPRADDLPSFSVDTTVTACTHNPLGVKGCGEAGAIGSPPAVINAIVNAINSPDVKHIEMPATPEKVWSAVQATAMAQAAE